VVGWPSYWPKDPFAADEIDLYTLGCSEDYAMKTLQISDEVYLKLKAFVADPFEDTPDNVLLRLMAIADKSKDRWSAFELPPESSAPEEEQPSRSQKDTIPEGTKIPDSGFSAAEVIL